MTSGDALRVGVAGATGALGGEIVATLGRVKWRPGTLLPLASRATKVTHVDFGDDRIAVDDLADADLSSLDLLFLAVPPDVAVTVAEAAMREGVLVVDATGHLGRAGLAPLTIPWVNPEALDQVDLAVSIPSPIAAMFAGVLGPLRRAGIGGRVEATVMLPASSFGRDGIDELSKQVVALFNQATPPRRVFREGLAFDIAPEVGTRGADGWTSAEVDARAELALLVPWSSSVDLTLVAAPLFTGIGATVSIEADRAAALELVARILADGGVRIEGRKPPRPRGVDGDGFLHAGRLRLGQDGRTVHLWLAMDGSKSSATLAVTVARLLLDRRATSS